MGSPLFCLNDSEDNWEIKGMWYLDNEKHQIDSRTYSRSRFDQKRLQKEDIQIAKELGYPAIVIKLLELEPDEYKRQHILTDARTGKYNKK